MLDLPWVCGNCRSINKPGSARCYSCRAPYALAVSADGRGVAPKIDEQSTPAEQARLAVRGGATYRSSSTRALVLQLVILGVTVASLAEFVIGYSFLDRLETAVTDADLAALDPMFGTLVLSLVVQVVAWLIGFVAWGLWLSRVIENVPALGGGFPKSTPDTALIASIIPGYNVYSATSILRDAMTRLADRGRAGVGLLTAWWIFLVLAILPIVGLLPGPARYIRLGYRLVTDLVVSITLAITGSSLSAVAVDGVFNGILLVIAAALAILVVNHVESLQEQRISVAHAAGAGAGAGAGAAGA